MHAYFNIKDMIKENRELQGTDITQISMSRRIALLSVNFPTF